MEDSSEEGIKIKLNKSEQDEAEKLKILEEDFKQQAEAIVQQARQEKKERDAKHRRENKKTAKQIQKDKGKKEEEKQEQLVEEIIPITQEEVVVPKKEVITGYEEIKVFAPDPLYGKSKFSISYWRTWWIKRKITKQAMVHMELANGLYRTFIVAIEQGKFNIGDNLYIIDDQSKHYNVDMKMYEYFYHESFTLPIKMKFPLTDIKKALEQQEKSEPQNVIYSSNPKTLKEFIISRIAEGVMAGASEDANWKQVKMMLGITMVATVIHLIYILFKTGFFDSASGALGI